MYLTESTPMRLETLLRAEHFKDAALSLKNAESTGKVDSKPIADCLVILRHLVESLPEHPESSDVRYLQKLDNVISHMMTSPPEELDNGIRVQTLMEEIVLLEKISGATRNVPLDIHNAFIFCHGMWTMFL